MRPYFTYAKTRICILKSQQVVLFSFFCTDEGAGVCWCVLSSPPSLHIYIYMCILSLHSSDWKLLREGTLALQQFGKKKIHHHWQEATALYDFTLKINK